MKYYTRQEVIDAGVPMASVDRWSRIFRDTPFVVKEKGKRFQYSAEFVAFALARKGHQGPANLPPTERIVALYKATRQGMQVQDIATQMKEHYAVIEAQLKLFGLPVVWKEEQHAAPTH